MSSLDILIGVIGIVGAWTGFVEWRIRTMYAQIKEKIEDVDKINKAEQANLKDTAIRLEAKIDMLIQMQLQANHNAQDFSKKQ